MVIMSRGQVFSPVMECSVLGNRRFVKDRHMKSLILAALAAVTLGVLASPAAADPYHHHHHCHYHHHHRYCR